MTKIEKTVNALNECNHFNNCKNCYLFKTDCDGSCGAVMCNALYLINNLLNQIEQLKTENTEIRQNSVSQDAYKQLMEEKKELKRPAKTEIDNNIPSKTRLEDFFEKYPDARVRVDGNPEVCCRFLDSNIWCHDFKCIECWNTPLGVYK